MTRLRSTLGDPDVVLTRPAGYGLAATRLRIDAWEFRDAVERARRLLHSDAPNGIAGLLDALSMWRAEAYGEVAADLALEEAAELEELRITATELVAEAHLRRGAPSEALAVVGRQRSSSLREGLVLLRARALATMGREPEALAALRRHRTQLSDELGLDPSGAVGDLERQLLRADASVPVDPNLGAPSRHVPQEPPRLRNLTVGRDADRSRAEAALYAARPVTLVGPGGVGKTRLAALIAQDRPRRAWVDLSSVRRGADVAPAFADAFGPVVPAREARAAVVAVLTGFPGLVVVDNCGSVGVSATPSSSCVGAPTRRYPGPTKRRWSPNWRARYPTSAPSTHAPRRHATSGPWPASPPRSTASPTCRLGRTCSRGATLSSCTPGAVDDDELARALAAAAAGAWMTGDVRGAVGLLSQAATLARDDRSRLTVEEAIGDAGIATGDLDGAVEAYRWNEACAERVGHAGLAAQARAGLALALFNRGERRAAHELVSQAVEQAEAWSAPSVSARSLSTPWVRYSLTRCPRRRSTRSTGRSSPRPPSAPVSSKAWHARRRSRCAADTVIRT